MKYLVSDIEVWREEIEALRGPEPGSRKVGKSEAIGLVAKELQAALQRGLTTSELLEFLAAKGLKVHEDTLRLAMRKVGRRAGAASGKGRRPSGGARRGVPAGAVAGRAGLEDERRDRADGGSGDHVGDRRDDERATTETKRGDDAHRKVESANASGGGEGAGAVAGMPASATGGRPEVAPARAPTPTMSAKVVRPDDQSDGLAAAAATAAAAPPAPAALPAASTQTKAPAVPTGRGTFTPRSDSDDL
jgi:hypothetical protein